MRWTCDRCDREFARTNTPHTCVPGTTVESVFDSRPAYQREVYDAILAHLLTSGPVHEDAVTVGVFLKAERKIAEVRPMARAVQVWLLLAREVSGPAVRKSEPVGAGRWAHDLRFTSVEQVDDQVRGWLDEAYDAAL